MYTDLLNKVWVGNIDDDVEKLLKVRFIYEYDDNYPEEALHMFAENESAIKMIYLVRFTQYWLMIKFLIIVSIHLQ